jgi:hypothetical protein
MRGREDASSRRLSMLQGNAAALLPLTHAPPGHTTARTSLAGTDIRIHDAGDQPRSPTRSMSCQNTTSCTKSPQHVEDDGDKGTAWTYAAALPPSGFEHCPAGPACLARAQSPLGPPDYRRVSLRTISMLVSGFSSIHRHTGRAASAQWHKNDRIRPGRMRARRAFTQASPSPGKNAKSFSGAQSDLS